MTEISFYHLQRQTLDQALPKLLERVINSSMRAVILIENEEQLSSLNAKLWNYDAGSFLPHGCAADGTSEEQPIYLTIKEENPNRADVLVVVQPCSAEFLTSFSRCLDIFNGNDTVAVNQARKRWVDYKEAGHPVTYWQQTERGGWETKA